jgi:hypothetical protein
VTPAISETAIQVIFLAIAFKITFCSFIIRSVSAADMVSGTVNSQNPAAYSDRTIHMLIGPDK